MSMHTLKFSEKEMKILNIVKAVKGLKNINQSISVIIEAYGKNEDYERFIQQEENRAKKK